MLCLWLVGPCFVPYISCFFVPLILIYILALFVSCYKNSSRPPANMVFFILGIYQEVNLVKLIFKNLILNILLKHALFNSHLFSITLGNFSFSNFSLIKFSQGNLTFIFGLSL